MFFGKTLIILLYSFTIAGSYGILEETDLRAILNRAREEIVNGNMIRALNIFGEGDAIFVREPEENLILKEEFLWESAMAYLDFADQLSNRDLYKHYAERARERWLSYIEWYHKLQKEKKDSLGEAHTRIIKATAHLGNSIIRMEEPTTLFADYADIQDVQYLGIDAFRLWKHWLYALPDMIPVKTEDRSDALRRQKICAGQAKDEWLIYAETLHEWAKEAYLRSSVRNRKIREAKRISEIAEECNNQ